MSDARRPKRVAEDIRSRLADALRRELGDPMLAELMITEVDVSDDLSSARIKVRLLTGERDDGRRAEALKRLSRAIPRLKRHLLRGLRLRRAPELRFTYDTGPDAVLRVEELIEEIHREPTGKDE
ncbi:MAG: 30S ribosome-binding factor RbfA [Polyangiaceae bacterium]|nr:30S ribosome-binding factor RbfA [Polyangiaceae bacterium]